MKRIDEIESELKNIAIEPDAYMLWKENSITRRFLLEIELDLLETQAQTIMSSTIEQIAINEIRRSEHAETLEAILSWNPITDSK